MKHIGNIDVKSGVVLVDFAVADQSGDQKRTVFPGRHTNIFYLNDLLDVAAPSPADEQVLTYDTASGNWIPSSLAVDVTGAFYLNDLFDVSVPSPNNLDHLVYNESTGLWEAEAQPEGVFYLNDLFDVDAPGANDQDHLIYDEASGTWKSTPFTDVVGAFYLNDLFDVNAASPDNLDHLVYNSGTGLWEATAQEKAVFYLNDLQDVNAPSPDDNDHLVYDEASGTWVPEPQSSNVFYFNDLQDVFVPGPDNGDTVQFNTATNRWEATALALPGAARDFYGSAEWIFNHNLAAANLVWATYDDNQRNIFPDEVDISDPNIAYFYFTKVVTEGRAVLVAPRTSTDPLKVVESAALFIETPTAKEYVFEQSAKFPYDIVDITHRTDAGEFYFSFFINNKSVFGFYEVETDTGEKTNVANGRNSVPLGGRVVFTASRVTATAVDFAASVKLNRND